MSAPSFSKHPDNWELLSKSDKLAVQHEEELGYNIVYWQSEANPRQYNRPMSIPGRGIGVDIS
jgi:hypothetical protein